MGRKTDRVNDPFEFKCAVDYGYSLEETVKAFTLVELAVNPGIPRPEALRKVIGVLKNFPKSRSDIVSKSSR
jgi:hypothetical protein